MDLEGYAKRKLRKKAEDEEIISGLVDLITDTKDISAERAELMARAILEEAKNTISLKSNIFSFEESGVKIGEFGVGSRGLGDFYVHQKIGEIIGGATSSKAALIDSSSLSDSGAVELPKAENDIVVVTVDGMHSRLSDFPFLAGFHVARAALRDVYVMGAEPIALFSDIHVADDGDVAKIFEHIAGISAVSDALCVPLVTGSTLRIGGDLVIGDRMTGCVGAVGITSKERVVTRSNAREGDVILMSEGSGGGTISTAALYHGEEDVVYETMNLNFLRGCRALLDKGKKLFKEKKIHVMTDVTNGGIRGDAEEISRSSGVSLVLHESKIRQLVNKRVLDMLERHDIDYLGVSLDALLIICSEDAEEEIKKIMREEGIMIDSIGHVEGGEKEESYIIIDGRREKLMPKFRESAYTPVKKAVGESHGEELFEEKSERVKKAVERAIEKKRKVLELISARCPPHA